MEDNSENNIDLLLEADLDDLDEDRLDDDEEPADLGLLVTRLGLEDNHCDEYDLETKELLSGSQKILHGDDGQLDFSFLRIVSENTESGVEESAPTEKSREESPYMPPSTSSLQFNCNSESRDDSVENIEERRNIVSAVLALMVDSIESLASLFSRPLETHSTMDTEEVLQIPLLPALIIDDNIEPDESAPVVSARVVTGKIDKLVEEAEMQKRRQQMEANEAELLLREEYEREQERLEQDRKQRLERARRREEARIIALQESSTVSLTKNFLN